MQNRIDIAKEARKIYEWVFELIEKYNLNIICLTDTYERRIYIDTLQRYSNFLFEPEVIKLLVDMINSSDCCYKATYTEQVYVGYSYVIITKY